MTIREIKRLVYKSMRMLNRLCDESPRVTREQRRNIRISFSRGGFTIYDRALARKLAGRRKRALVVL